jgi:hypothetical protein
MKTLVRILLVAAVLGGLVNPAFAVEKATEKKASTPGLEAAKTLSTVTGVAISPLMGVGAIGAYDYFNTAPEKRANLHWYAQPWFWLPALLLVGLVAAKDVLGTAAPTALKKPFDVAETLENKVSGMVAAGTFVPFMVTIFPTAADQTTAALHQAGFAAISSGQLANWLMVPFAIALFLVVWLASHAINILILISPFTTVDTALKSLRLSVLGMVTITAWINPWMGALFSAVVVVVAWLIAGWAFRLMVLGQVYVWDFFTLRRHRFLPTANGNWMFAARAIDKTPIRTYGKLSTDTTGKRIFEYRPWLVLPKRTLELPPGNYAVGRGLFYPEVMRVDGSDTKTVFILPPRYKGHEADLAKACNTPDVRDVGILKGFKAIGSAMRSLFGAGDKREIAATA